MWPRGRNDWLLLSVIGVLTACGLIMVFSASSVVSQEKNHSSWYIVSRQFMWAVVAAGTRTWSSPFRAVAFQWMSRRLSRRSYSRTPMACVGSRKSRRAAGSSPMGRMEGIRRVSTG